MGNTGQTLLAIGLLIVITVLVINSNRMIVRGSEDRYNGIARMEAADIAADVLHEAELKRFDRYSIQAYYMVPSEFSTVANLGPDGTEPKFTTAAPDTGAFKSYQGYSDFDDYNGYVRGVNTANLGGYVVTVRVFYSTYKIPDVALSSRSYVKTMEVSVSHPAYLTTPIKFSGVKVY